jgi:predicted dehydrogenase
MTNALVVGYGSIGQRHVRLLVELGCEVAVVSRREVEFAPRFASIAAALAARTPEYVVVANETSAHAAAVAELLALGFNGRLLVEKPIGLLAAKAFDGAFRVAAAGYNLRFHPALAALAETVAEERLIAIQIYCGQYLPDWRPGTDYRQAYSADPARGGGVLRDLSHELDYLLWLCGAWRRVAAVGGRFGALNITSDDCWALLLEMERCPAATVQINYLDRPGQRKVIVNTEHHTYCADLVRSLLARDGETRTFSVDRDDTYRALHRAVLAGDSARLCSLADGERVMRLIAAAEQAAAAKQWVSA